MILSTRSRLIGLAVIAGTLGFAIAFWLAFTNGRGAEAQREPVELFLTGYGYPAGLEQATEDAIYIVEGTVTVAGPAQWSNIDGSSDELVGRDRWDAVSRIVTPYRIDVSSTLKGESRDSVIVWQLGGEVDGDSLIVDPSIAPVADGEQGIFYVFDESEESYLQGIADPQDGIVFRALVVNTEREESPSRATQADLDEARSIARNLSTVGGGS
jgi:hypothetical protein